LIIIYLFCEVSYYKHCLLVVLAFIVFFSCRNGSQANVYTKLSLAGLASPALDSGNIRQGLLFHRLDSFFARRHQFGGFNGNVVILKGGRVLYKGCFGYCNISTKDTLDSQTPFQIASSSKPFTSTAILRLVDEGKLALSDTLGKFFPGFPYRGITVEMLLCHRSGLPNYLFFGQKYWKDRSVYMTNDALLDILMKNKNIEGTSRPGRFFQYNNTNFALLASVVEKVTGKRFPDYMKETFFDPLGMKNTWVRDVQNEKEERRHAISYNSAWKIQAEDPYDGVYGDKNVFSTTEDMMKWDWAFYEEKNLSKEWQAEAYKPRSFEQRGARNYGYGWRLIKQPNGETVVFHNGWWHGNNTVFYRYIPDSLAVIVLSNHYNVGVYDIQPVFSILGATRDTVASSSEEAQ
jgi:CubicO group peptidase (beta-lactamase class C family)